ncbi:MAG: DUF4153 domain-containing protein [Bacillota bacterium]|nr:DUF4153 domain-containing protein [Bacillota bacterium]
MKKFFAGSLQKIFLSSKRFAVTNVAAFLLALTMSASLRLPFLDTPEWGMFLLMMIPLSASVHLIGERVNWEVWKTLILQAIVAAASWLYVMMLWEPYAVRSVGPIGIIAVSTIAVAMIPYLWDREGLGKYVLQIVSTFFLSLFFMLVLFAGSTFITLSISMLFDLDYSWGLFRDIASIVFVFLWPLTFFAFYPERESEPRKVAFLYRALFLYILLPLLLIYTVILYVYFLKLAVERSFPENTMGHLVSWYLLVAIATIYFSRSIEQQQGEFARWALAATHYFGYVLLVPIAMLFYSVGLRIMLYGMTIPRYLLLMVAVFSLISTFLLLWNHRLTQHWVPGVAAALILVATFGYFSAYQVSLRSQTARFDRIYEDRIQKPLAAGVDVMDLDPEALDQARDIYAYLNYELDHMPAQLEANAEIRELISSYAPYTASKYEEANAPRWSQYYRKDEVAIVLGSDRWFVMIQGPDQSQSYELDDETVLFVTEGKLSIESGSGGNVQRSEIVDLGRMVDAWDIDAEQLSEVRSIAGGLYELSFVPESI